MRHGEPAVPGTDVAVRSSSEASDKSKTIGEEREREREREGYYDGGDGRMKRERGRGEVCKRGAGWTST